MQVPCRRFAARPLVWVALVLGVIALAAISPATAATFAPFALLLLVLLRGLHPGEDLIERLLTRHAPRRRRAGTAGLRPALPLVPRRAGRAQAHALAMRPPPAALAVSI